MFLGVVCHHMVQATIKPQKGPPNSNFMAVFPKVPPHFYGISQCWGDRIREPQGARNPLVVLETSDTSSGVGYVTRHIKFV